MAKTLTSSFRETYESGDSRISVTSPEIVFMEAACENNVEKALAVFCEEKQFGGKTAINSPHGEFYGLKDIRGFTENFLSSFQATGGKVYPIIQTRANGRSVTEMVVSFDREMGKLEIPMCVVGDLRPENKLDHLRIYFFFQWVEGFSPYRKPIFKSSYQKCAEYSLMTGAVKEYFKALHTEGGIERIMEVCDDDVCYGGYRPNEIEKIMHGKKELRNVYEGICADAPSKYSVRAETITDDGVNCVVEWNLMITELGKKAGFLHVPGVAVYERRDNGKLKSIRICDDNGFFDLVNREMIEE